MKTKEELNDLKTAFETLNRKLAELTADELADVTGGFIPVIPPAERKTDAERKGIAGREENWEDPKYILGLDRGDAVR